MTSRSSFDERKTTLRARRQWYAGSLIALLISLACWPSPGEEPAAPDAALSSEQSAFFERHIRPLLVAKCYECHSSEARQVEGKLLLDTREALRRGGETGPAIVLGDPDKSRLIRAVRYTDPLLQMPPDERLSQREIDLLVEWVRLGAPDPRGGASQPDLPKVRPVNEAARQWWSFQPLQDSLVPPTVNNTWPQSDVDRFVFAKMADQGLAPAPPADKRTLLRRVTFDLTGLPPTPEEIDAFLADDSSTAFATVVDRLLASRHYGERWGRHWLDVVRYADTSGCNGDFPIVQAYRYRNYVIQSFNADKPYDQFVREQIAGDLLPANGDEQRFENLIATGYLALSRRFSSLNEEFHLTLDDTVDNLGKAFLGLSISCARCHDHKFDPIPQADYYALFGIFQSTTYAFPGTEIYRHTQHLTPLVSAEQLKSELRQPLDAMNAIDADIFTTYSTMAEMDTGKEKNALKAKVKELQQQRDEMVRKLPKLPFAYAAAEGAPVRAKIHLKGDPKNLGPEVPRGFLQVLGGQQVPPDESGSGRRQLAEWITDPTNPLTARVIVNRVWLHHFGRGLIRTPDDFGTRGEAPTHPELLDYLSQRLIADGWSLKALHRLLLLSKTYQMACIENPTYYERDPDNKLLWTFNRRRLEAEEIRDAMLAISGGLDGSMGQAHPFPPEVEWRYSQHKPFVEDYPTSRRSIYLMQPRIRQQPLLAIFDGADANTATGLRQASTVAPQALFMLNSEFVHEQAALFADRVTREASQEADRIALAYRLAFGRSPATDELQEARDYLRQVSQRLAETSLPDNQRTRAAWASFVRVLLSGNAFLFVD
jgi:hypothetical protein